jgi:hypothetical protein
MNPQMGILYLSDTNHVLASFTRSAEPLQPDKIPDPFIGDGLHVRVAGPPTTVAGFDTLDLVVTSANLRFTEAALDSRALAAPRDYFVDNSLRLNTFSAGPITIQPAAPSPTFTIKAPVPPAKLQFVLLVQSWAPGSTQYLSSPLSAAGDGNVNLSTLPSGNYHILICVPDYPIVLREITVP